MLNNIKIWYANLKLAYNNYTPNWFSDNLLKIISIIIAGYLAATISWPNLASYSIIAVVDNVFIPLKDFLINCEDGRAYAVLGIALFLIFFFCLFVFSFTRGVAIAGLRIIDSLKKQDLIYSDCHKAIDSLITVDTEEFNTKLGETFKIILEKMLMLDSETLENDESHLFDNQGNCIASTKEPNDVMRNFGNRIPEGLIKTLRLTKKEVPAFFSELRNFNIIEIVPFESLDNYYYIVIFSPRLKAMEEINYCRIIETFNRLITLRSFFFLLQERYTTIETETEIEGGDLHGSGSTEEGT